MNSNSLVYLYKQKKTEHWITWSDDDDDGMSYADLKRLFKKLDRESTWCNYCHEVNPFAPGDFAQKRVLKLVEWFSGHCRAIKS